MTFRQQMERQTTRFKWLMWGGMLTAAAASSTLHHVKPGAQPFVWVAVAWLVVIGVVLLRTRCPRCSARLPWTIQQIAKHKEIAACPQCALSFDDPSLPNSSHVTL
jgi:hypothetical protein